MFFQNPGNGYIEQVTLPRLWTLLFGPIYFASRGVWTHCVASLLLAICTGGLSWLFYPFAAKRIMQVHYLRRGWMPLSRAEVREQTREHRRSHSSLDEMPSMRRQRQRIEPSF